MKHRPVQLYVKVAHLNKNNKIFRSIWKPCIVKRFQIYFLHFRKYETKKNVWIPSAKATLLHPDTRTLEAAV